MKKTAKKRYGVYYYKIAGATKKQDASGSTDSLVNAIGNAVSHCARSELADNEYAQAMVIDRRASRILRTYKRTAGNSITCKEHPQ